MTITEQMLAELEDLRTGLQTRGPVPPRADRFINEMAALVIVTGDPQKALDIAFRVLATETTEGVSA